MPGRQFTMTVAGGDVRSTKVFQHTPARLE
jgi:hypothetical protein